MSYLKDIDLEREEAYDEVIRTVTLDFLPTTQKIKMVHKGKIIETWEKIIIFPGRSKTTTIG